MGVILFLERGAEQEIVLIKRWRIGPGLLGR